MAERPVTPTLTTSSPTTLGSPSVRQCYLENLPGCRVEWLLSVVSDTTARSPVGCHSSKTRLKAKPGAVKS